MKSGTVEDRLSDKVWSFWIPSHALDLQNVPATFQHFINSVLHEFLNKFASAYLDDIIIYSKTKNEHREHVQKVLRALQKAGLQIDINKCEFTVQETKYLGLIITSDGIKMDPQKVEAILQWKTFSHFLALPISIDGLLKDSLL